MGIRQAFQDLLHADIPASFQCFGSVLDSAWITGALGTTGTASVRRRKLPSPLVVWLVIGMALFRDRSIREVVSHLGLVLPGRVAPPGLTCRSVAPSAIPQGRSRLGARPIQEIFERTSAEWAAPAAGQDRWRGLALYGMDGTTLRVPDTNENRATFGLPVSGRAQSGYPQVRVMALMALRSHLIAAAVFGPCAGKQTGEHTLAQELWSQVPEKSLIAVDRGLIDYGVFFRLSHDEQGQITGDRHWVTRGKKNLRWKTLRVLGPGDELVELPISRQARQKDPTLPVTMVARAIRYQVKGYQPQTLLTSLVDSVTYPANEIVGLYHERWELELGYDEIKTHMLESEEALRSKKADGVRQEIWGILLAYNLVRKKMLEVAEDAGLMPTRVSFRHSLQLIRVFCLVESWTSAPANLPKRLSGLQEMMGLLILPERRTERRYERHVKIKMSAYKRNRGRPVVQPIENKEQSA
jgi:Insertion element 4 transposase N-terminal/Transposase DDE domain